jgi:hypothetical protein
MLDFPSALARLLRDGALRERFSRDPVGAIADLPLEEGDRAALLALDPHDLEMQAGVLLHKRFEEVRRILASTFARLGDSAWPLFQEYARYTWPNGESDAWADASAFGEHLMTERRKDLLPAERNRTTFAVGAQRLRIKLVRALPVGGRLRPAIQVFWRPKPQLWREFVLFPAL